MRKLNLGLAFAAALAASLGLRTRDYAQPPAPRKHKRSALNAHKDHMPAGTKMLREAKAGMIGKRNGRKL